MPAIPRPIAQSSSRKRLSTICFQRSDRTFSSFVNACTCQQAGVGLLLLLQLLLLLV
jgi:hypothetical protein